MTARQYRRGDKTLLDGAGYGRLPLSHYSKEDSYVLPPPGHRMDHHHPRPLAPFEHRASDRLGPVEPGDGAGALLCVDGRQCLPGHLARPQRTCCIPAVARVVRRGDGQARDGETCFGPLLTGVVDQWEGTQMALALDATTLGDRLTVLALSVVYRGCAIPVAWTVLAATAKHAWRREGLRMLRQVRWSMPRSCSVVLLAY